MTNQDFVEIIVKEIGELAEVSGKILSNFPDKRIFAFYGPLGVGKTMFIQEICRVLGVRDSVLSPSFAILNEYQTKRGEPLYHFDFYRIRKPEEALDIGFEEYLDSGCYCFIEWPEMVEEMIPGDAVRVTISGETERKIQF